jgi:hypothetical protein
MTFSNGQLDAIQMAPVAIFLLVAGADGRRSSTERHAYLSTWRAKVDADLLGPMAKDPRYEQVWQWVFTADTDHFAAMSDMPDESLWEVVERAGKSLRAAAGVPHDDADPAAIVRSFLDLAKLVAEAPAMTFLGTSLGGSVSEEERAVIRRIVRLTRVDAA